MNSAGKALLNLMRVEVLLGVGLVLWVMSIEARAEADCPFSGQEIDALRDNAISKNKFSLVRALNSCGADNAKASDQALLDNVLEILNIAAVSELIQASDQEKSRSLRADLEKEAQNREMRVQNAGYSSSAATLVNRLPNRTGTYPSRFEDDLVANAKATNDLLLVIIQQNDEIISLLKEEKDRDSDTNTSSR